MSLFPSTFFFFYTTLSTLERRQKSVLCPARIHSISSRRKRPRKGLQEAATMMTAKVEDIRKITTTNEWTTARRLLFIASVLSVFAFAARPLDSTRPSLLCSCVLACLCCTLRVFCFPLFQQHECQWLQMCLRDGTNKEAFYQAKARHFLDVISNVFFIPKFLPASLSITIRTLRCGESRVWPICQRCYSIKVCDRRLCRSVFPEPFHREYQRICVRYA
jgi:hypothetical protein